MILGSDTCKSFPQKWLELVPYIIEATGDIKDPIVDSILWPGKNDFGHLF